jgi:outer membrane protein assembly factor BamB
MVVRSGGEQQLIPEGLFPQRSDGEIKRFMVHKKAIGVLILSAMVVITSYFVLKPPKEKDRWAKKYLGAGSSSSPRPADLNGDGILDLVMGAGAREYESTEYAVFAINGADGEVLWQVSGINQIFGSAAFKDITGDSISDVFIGGRSAQFFAINGRTGAVIWDYLREKENPDLKNDTTLLNFYTPQFIPDQNGDGHEDLLVSFGGFLSAGPGDPNRPSGKLVVLDIMTGTVLAELYMPDGNECYMSPVVHDFNGDGNISVVFGSGGETLNGNLYRMPLAGIMQNDRSQLVHLDSGQGKGFIAPPVLADINEDEIKDIVITSMNGRMTAFNGNTNEKIWEADFGNHAETQAMAAPGDFDGDDIPDFFGVIGFGVWPRIDTAIHVLINGKNGREMFRDTLGVLQFSSPVTFDMDRDGTDDVIYYVNSFENNNYYDRHFINQVYVYNFGKDKVYPLSPQRAGANIGSTPLVSDLDKDGMVDLVFCYVTEDTYLSSFTHLVVERVELDIPLKRNLWGSYMGTDFTSVYHH